MDDFHFFLGHGTDLTSTLPSSCFGWVLKDKINSKRCISKNVSSKLIPFKCLSSHYFVSDFHKPLPGFKEVHLSYCWVTCISRQSKLCRRGQSKGKHFSLVQVPFLTWLLAVELPPAPRGRKHCTMNCQHQQREKAIFTEPWGLKQC